MNQSFPSDIGFHKLSLDVHLDALYNLDCEIFNMPPILLPFDKKDDLYKYIAKDHRCDTYIFNKEDGETVGYFSVEYKLEVPNMVELINLGIRPKLQKQGWGTKLMKKVIELVGGRDCRLVTHPNNISTRLYTKFGFRPVKIIKNYFGDGEPRLLFVRFNGEMKTKF